MRRQNNEYRNHPNSPRPPSRASSDSKDGSVDRSSHTGSEVKRNSRSTTGWAPKTYSCLSPSEDSMGHGPLVSDAKSSVQSSSHTVSGVTRNSRITSISAPKTSSCVLPSEDLIRHGLLGPDVKTLTSGIEVLNLSPNSPVESDESVKEFICPQTKKLDETNLKAGHQGEESPAKELGLKNDLGYFYDICPPKSRSVTLKTPLFEKNREIRKEKMRNMEGGDISIIRPGMILLRKYLSARDQVKLVKICRMLGMEPGGFYQPGYCDGPTLNLKMMCLGKRWEPEKGYVDITATGVPSIPLIPDEFSQLVERVLKDSHAHLKEKHKNKKVEDILPSMTPNICIVNFYTTTGRLGLHQDKDESSESLARGLPVISFSLGDSAVFLYGDDRDVFKAEKVILESGDVLIFGGKSRHIYHGVSDIMKDTAPKSLLEATDLRPGRLNLTFRQY